MPVTNFSISDESKARLIVSILKEGEESRLYQVLQDTIRVSVICAALGVDAERKFAHLKMVSQSIDDPVLAARYLRFIRKAMCDETVQKVAGPRIREAEEVLRSRFDPDDMERSTLVVDIMQD